MFLLRANDAAMMARKMMVPMTKMMTMIKTTPSTPTNNFFKNSFNCGDHQNYLDNFFFDKCHKGE